jgi:hypothetical protein
MNELEQRKARINILFDMMEFIIKQQRKSNVSINKNITTVISLPWAQNISWF